MLAVVLCLFAWTKFNSHQGAAGQYYKGAASQGLDRQGDGNGKRLIVNTNQCSIFKRRAGERESDHSELDAVKVPSAVDLVNTLSLFLHFSFVACCKSLQL